MPQLQNSPLLRKCHDVMQAIEACGASEKLTHAVTLAGDLLRAIDGAIEQKDKRIAELEAERVVLMRECDDANRARRDCEGDLLRATARIAELEAALAEEKRLSTATRRRHRCGEGGVMQRYRLISVATKSHHPVLPPLPIEDAKGKWVTFEDATAYADAYASATVEQARRVAFEEAAQIADEMHRLTLQGYAEYSGDVGDTIRARGEGK